MQDEPSTTQPLSPFAYAITALISGIIAISLLLLYVYQVPKLIANGIQEEVFYLLLIPWALSCAVFLFGIMRSYMRISNQSVPTSIELGGPVAIFCLVVWGGFNLVPQLETFDLTVRPLGEQDALITAGKITMDFGNLRRSEDIGTQGEANFKGVARKFWGKSVKVLPEVEGYDAAFQSATISDNVLDLHLKKESDHQTVLTGNITPPPGREKLVRLVVEGHRGEGQAKPNGEFSFPVRGKDGDRVRLRAYVGDNLVYDEYRMLPGPLTVEISKPLVVH